MFTAVVKRERIQKATGQDYLRLIPLGIWAVLCFVLLALFCRKIYWAGILLLTIFLCIIPIAIYMAKTNPRLKEDRYYEEEVSFEVKNGTLYANGLKITDVFIDSRAKEIHIDNEAFSAVVEEPYIEAFEAYLRSNNITLQDG